MQIFTAHLENHQAFGHVFVYYTCRTEESPMALQAYLAMLGRFLMTLCKYQYCPLFTDCARDKRDLHLRLR